MNFSVQDQPAAWKEPGYLRAVALGRPDAEELSENCPRYRHLSLPEFWAQTRLESEPRRFQILHPVRHRSVCGRVVPRPLHPLADAIERGRYVLDLPDNWDGEGSPAYEEATWQRMACEFIDASVDLERRGVIVPPPSVSHGPDGSLDVSWESADVSLLVNVPAGDGALSFYGRRRTGGEIKGELPSPIVAEVLPALLAWVAAQ